MDEDYPKETNEPLMNHKYSGDSNPNTNLEYRSGNRITDVNAKDRNSSHYDFPAFLTNFSRYTTYQYLDRVVPNKNGVSETQVVNISVQIHLHSG